MSTFEITDWQYEVANGDTVRGYAEWRVAQLESTTQLPLPGEVAGDGGTIIGSVWGTNTSSDTDDGSIFYWLLVFTESDTFEVRQVSRNLSGAYTADVVNTSDNIVDASRQFAYAAGL